MQITSSAFENEALIPVKYTCEGEDVSPPLTWKGVPEEAHSLALIMDDPDAPRGTFTHWVVYNLPVIPPKIDEGESLSERFEEGLREGFNDFGKQGYGGPCPPRSHGEHHYYFRLFALKQKLDLTGRVTRAQLLEKIDDFVIDEAVLMGRFSRE